MGRGLNGLAKRVGGGSDENQVLNVALRQSIVSFCFQIESNTFSQFSHSLKMPPHDDFSHQFRPSPATPPPQPTGVAVYIVCFASSHIIRTCAESARVPVSCCVSSQSRISSLNKKTVEGPRDNTSPQTAPLPFPRRLNRSSISSSRPSFKYSPPLTTYTTSRMSMKP